MQAILYNNEGNMIRTFEITAFSKIKENCYDLTLNIPESVDYLYIDGATGLFFDNERIFETKADQWKKCILKSDNQIEPITIVNHSQKKKKKEAT
jgi:hypothetical protein